MYECLWDRELLMENICVASKTEQGLVRVCLLCLSVCSLPALVIVLLGVSGVLWFLLLLPSPNLARVFVSRVAPSTVRVRLQGWWLMPLKVLKHTYGLWDPFWGEHEEGEGSSAQRMGEACLDSYRRLFYLVPVFIASKAWTRRMETRGRKAFCLDLPFHL